jgi:hypothetical protein
MAYMKSKQTSSRSMTGASGGGNRMAGKSGAAPAVSGQVSLGGRSGGNSFEHRGGSNRMAGFTGARPAKAC